MLNIYFGESSIFMDNKVSHVSEYFDAVYEQEWLDCEWSRRVIREIDKSTYVCGEYIESPVLGGISPRDLSSGCKALILANFMPELLISGDRMGDNCYPLLLELAEEKDLYITLCHLIDFRKFEPFKVRNAVTGDIITEPIKILDALLGDCE